MRTLILLAVAAATLSCGDSDAEEAPPTAELTRRQKDSLIADMPLPGAGAVGRALEVLEASEQRAEAHDTIGRRFPLVP